MRFNTETANIIVYLRNEETNAIVETELETSDWWARLESKTSLFLQARTARDNAQTNFNNISGASTQVIIPNPIRSPGDMFGALSEYVNREALITSARTLLTNAETALDRLRYDIELMADMRSQFNVQHWFLVSVNGAPHIVTVNSDKSVSAVAYTDGMVLPPIS